MPTAAPGVRPHASAPGATLHRPAPPVPSSSDSEDPGAPAALRRQFQQLHDDVIQAQMQAAASKERSRALEARLLRQQQQSDDTVNRLTSAIQALQRQRESPDRGGCAGEVREALAAAAAQRRAVSEGRQASASPASDDAEAAAAAAAAVASRAQRMETASAAADELDVVVAQLRATLELREEQLLRERQAGATLEQRVEQGRRKCERLAAMAADLEDRNARLTEAHCSHVASLEDEAAALRMRVASLSAQLDLALRPPPGGGETPDTATPPKSPTSPAQPGSGSEDEAPPPPRPPSPPTACRGPSPPPPAQVLQAEWPPSPRRERQGVDPPPASNAGRGAARQKATSKGGLPPPSPRTDRQRREQGRPPAAAPQQPLQQGEWPPSPRRWRGAAPPGGPPPARRTEWPPSPRRQRSPPMDEREEDTGPGTWSPSPPTGDHCYSSSPPTTEAVGRGAAEWPPSPRRERSPPDQQPAKGAAEWPPSPRRHRSPEQVAAPRAEWPPSPRRHRGEVPQPRQLQTKEWPPSPRRQRSAEPEPEWGPSSGGEQPGPARRAAEWPPSPRRERAGSPSSEDEDGDFPRMNETTPQHVIQSRGCREWPPSPRRQRDPPEEAPGSGSGSGGEWPPSPRRERTAEPAAAGQIGAWRGEGADPATAPRAEWPPSPRRQRDPPGGGGPQPGAEWPPSPRRQRVADEGPAAAAPAPRGEWPPSPRRHRGPPDGAECGTYTVTYAPPAAAVLREPRQHMGDEPTGSPLGPGLDRTASGPGSPPVSPEWPSSPRRQRELGETGVPPRGVPPMPLAVRSEGQTSASDSDTPLMPSPLTEPTGGTPLHHVAPMPQPTGRASPLGIPVRGPGGASAARGQPQQPPEPRRRSVGIAGAAEVQPRKRSDAARVDFAEGDQPQRSPRGRASTMMGKGAGGPEATLSPAVRQRAEAAFRSADSLCKQDGSVSKKELFRLLREEKLAAKVLFLELDENQSGEVDLEEWFHFFGRLEAKGQSAASLLDWIEDRLMQAHAQKQRVSFAAGDGLSDELRRRAEATFERIDSECKKDGKVSKEELSAVLRQELVARVFFRELDTDSSGDVSKAEWLRWLTKNKGSAASMLDLIDEQLRQAAPAGQPAGPAAGQIGYVRMRSSEIDNAERRGASSQEPQDRRESTRSHAATQPLPHCTAAAPEQVWWIQGLIAAAPEGTVPTLALLVQLQ